MTDYYFATLAGRETKDRIIYDVSPLYTPGASHPQIWSFTQQPDGQSIFVELSVDLPEHRREQVDESNSRLMLEFHVPYGSKSIPKKPISLVRDGKEIGRIPPQAFEAGENGIAILKEYMREALGGEAPSFEQFSQTAHQWLQVRKDNSRMIELEESIPANKQKLQKLNKKIQQDEAELHQLEKKWGLDGKKPKEPLQPVIEEEPKEQAPKSLLQASLTPKDMEKIQALAATGVYDPEPDLVKHKVLPVYSTPRSRKERPNPILDVRDDKERQWLTDELIKIGKGEVAFSEENIGLGVSKGRSLGIQNIPDHGLGAQTEKSKDGKGTGRSGGN